MSYILGDLGRISNALNVERHTDAIGMAMILLDEVLISVTGVQQQLEQMRRILEVL